MKKYILRKYKNFLIKNINIWFKYKRFLDNQLNYCYHSVEDHNNSKQ